MPLAAVTRNPAIIDNGVCEALAPLIRQFVVDALGTGPNDQLSIDEVEVRFHDVGPFDLNSSPLAIEVFANDTPARRVRVENGAARLIASGVKAVFGNDELPPLSVLGDSSFVWIFLGFGGFARI